MGLPSSCFERSAVLLTVLSALSGLLLSTLLLLAGLLLSAALLLATLLLTTLLLLARILVWVLIHRLSFPTLVRRAIRSDAPRRQKTNARAQYSFPFKYLLNFEEMCLESGSNVHSSLLMT